MNSLQKRRFAVGVFVATAIVFSLIGCHLSLSRRCRQVEADFFTEEALAPGTQLDECVKLSNRILSVINGTLDDTLYDSLYDARLAMAEAVENRDASAACQCNPALCEAVDAVEAAAAGISFDSTEDLTQLLSDFHSAQRVAAESDYNAAVDSFMENTANRFPTNILRHLAFVDMPERFEAQ